MINSPDLSTVIYGKDFITYDRMYHLTQYAFHGTPDGTADSINVFIDMNSMLRMMYGTIPYQLHDYTCITASMVNLCAHIRAYFWSRHMVSTVIYLVYGDNNPPLDIVEPGYNSAYLASVAAKSQLTELVSSSLDLLDILLPYVRETYFIRGHNVETSAIIYGLIQDYSRQRGAVPNVVYTRDSYAYQLVAYCPRTYLYRARKGRDGDASWAVTKTSLLERYRHELGLTEMDCNQFDYRILPLIMTIGGLKSRSLKGFTNTTRAMKMLEKFEVSSMDALSGLAGQVPEFWSRFTTLDGNALCARFRSIDLMTHTRDIQARDHGISLHNIIDLHDPEGFKEINNKYFINYPLDVERL